VHFAGTTGASPLLVLALHLLEVVVDASARQQLLVRAELYHAAVVEDGNGVGVLYRRQTVSDDDARPAQTGFVQSFLYHLRRAYTNTLS